MILNTKNCIELNLFSLKVKQFVSTTSYQWMASEPLSEEENLINLSEASGMVYPVFVG